MRTGKALAIAEAFSVLLERRFVLSPYSRAGY